MAKKPFERVGNYLRFKQPVEGQERGFEFYHEPFEGRLADNIELFTQMYESGEPGRMQQGVNLLAQSKSEKAIPCLINALKDNKFTGRAIAAAGLANYPGNKKAMKALAGTFTSGDYLLTLTAIGSLGKIGVAGAKKQVRKVLTRCLRREDLFRSDQSSGPAAVMALACISTLLELQDEKHRPFLLRFLAHPVWEVRYQAARIYAKFPDRNAETLLRKLSGDANPLLRLSAAEALIKLGEKSCYEIIEEIVSLPEPAVRATAAATLGDLGSGEAFDIMERALVKESDAGLRLEMARRLRAKGRDVGIEEIRGGLEHENPFIRQAAIKAAGDLGTQSEMSLLRDALASEPDEFLKEQIERNLSEEPGADSA